MSDDHKRLDTPHSAGPDPVEWWSDGPRLVLADGTEVRPQLTGPDSEAWFSWEVDPETGVALYVEETDVLRAALQFERCGARDPPSEMRSTRDIADEYLREEYDIRLSDLSGDETSRLAFERDTAVHLLKSTRADLQVIRLALQENRPLEALKQVIDATDRLEDTLDDLDAAEGGLFPDGDADA